jgi:hypothetical protein
VVETTVVDVDVIETKGIGANALVLGNFCNESVPCLARRFQNERGGDDDAMAALFVVIVVVIIHYCFPDRNPSHQNCFGGGKKKKKKKKKKKHFRLLQQTKNWTKNRKL